MPLSREKRTAMTCTAPEVGGCHRYGTVTTPGVSVRAARGHAAPPWASRACDPVGSQTARGPRRAACGGGHVSPSGLRALPTDPREEHQPSLVGHVESRFVRRLRVTNVGHAWSPGYFHASLPVVRIRTFAPVELSHPSRALSLHFLNTDLESSSLKADFCTSHHTPCRNSKSSLLSVIFIPFKPSA